MPPEEDNSLFVQEYGNIYLNNSKEGLLFPGAGSTDSPGCDLATEKCELSAVGTPHRPPGRSQELVTCVYDTREHFWDTNKKQGVLKNVYIQCNS